MLQNRNLKLYKVDMPFIIDTTLQKCRNNQIYEEKFEMPYYKRVKLEILIDCVLRRFKV